MPRSHTRLRWAAAASAALLAGIALAAVAGLAAATSFTVGTAKNIKVGSKHENVAVNSKGVTVYVLVPETTKHLLCTKACLGFWPPVTVSSAHAKLTKAAGVSGRLGVFRRGSNFQVTLNGHPLYTFKADRGKPGVANGDGIPGPGHSTWHVIKVTSVSGTTSTGSTSSTSSSSTTSTTTPYMWG